MPGRFRLGKEAYKALCLKVMQRDGWKCRCCKKRSNLHVHHVSFRSEGGGDTSDNLILVCGGAGSCHDAIHGLIPGYYIIVLPASGNPEDVFDADVGCKFITYGRIRKRVKLKAKTSAKHRGRLTEEDYQQE